MNKILILCTMVITLLSGCKDITISQPNIDTQDMSKTNNTNISRIALICSLTKVDPKYYDGWDGDCPGTDVDANNFKLLCEDNKIPYIKLENSQCTINNIIKNWTNCISKISKDGLFIFFYSGHGGQVYNPNETDGCDETLCFWDGQFVDDRVWELLRKMPQEMRCFMVTDCCNSGSNYQLPYVKKVPYNLGSTKESKARGIIPNLLHIGGCNDGEYSYGSNRGGYLTLNLKKNYSKKISYYNWFELTKTSMRNSGQIPTFAETGKSFKHNVIFQ